MRYQFNQAVSLNKVTYLQGVHDVAWEVESHPFFLQLVKGGLIVEADQSKEVVKESIQERSKRLYDRLTGNEKKAVQPEKVEKLEDSEIQEDKKKKAKR